MLSVVINMKQKRTGQNFGNLQQIKLGLCVTLAALLFAVFGICVYQSAVFRPKQAPEESKAQIQEQHTTAKDPQQLQEAGYLAKPQKAVIQQTKQMHTDTEEKTEAARKTTYRLAVKNGCLQVYINETDHLYMETTIAYELLPEDVQVQVKNGKFFDTEERLLEFLESYSS